MSVAPDASIPELDVRRLLCPIPVIRTQDRVKTMVPGALLDVLTTDPGVLNDLPAWCRINGHRVVATDRRDGTIVVRVEVGGAAS